jgi:hypothetical protein
MFDIEQTPGARARTPTAMSKTSPHQLALSRWDGEGGALAGEAPGSARRVSPSELMQLRIRVIALENLVIGLLAQASHRQLNQVRDMAAYISPRPGRTPHRTTLHAAAQMVHLVDRAGHFHGMPTGVLVAAPG